MKYVGVDVGGMSVKCGVVSSDGKILYKKVAPIKAKADDSLILADVAKLIEDTLFESGTDKAQIGGIGIGCPGSVYDEEGIVRYSCNINFKNTPITKIISELTGIENVRVSNDANCAALGETLFGAGEGAKNSVLVTLGTGLGTGIIVDGKLLTGNKSAGAEGGHISINMGGALCGCGRRGHYEAYASATALMHQVEAACKKHPDSLLAKYAEEHGIDGKTVFICAKQGDKVAIATLNRYIKYVGEGLLMFANIFFPEVIIIGGGLSNEGEALIAPLQKIVSENVYGAQYNPQIRVVGATLKNDAGIIGAAALVTT
ncbi:MAG: ROK family protein [Bacteroides sp.]|nr:ROK family protein [Bacillota bacterium]MCM1393585.1 ROK family protein [[Eubacterium] siraeum]MCM1454996.1 ROK family protein [Bacteroides sp.]